MQSLRVVEQSFTDVVGTWTAAFAQPPAELAAEVVAFWESGGPVTVGHIKLIPRGTVDIIVNLGAHQTMYRNATATTRTRFKRAWISGLFSRPLFVGPDLRNQEVINHLVGVSLRPEAVMPVLGVSAGELVNRVFDADLLLGPGVEKLRDRLGTLASATERLSLLADYVTDLKLQLARPAPFAAMAAAAQLQASAGSKRVDELAADLRISRRQLNRQFQQVTGLTPKTFARLTRFRAVADLLNRPGVDLADLSYRFGFSDQAHLSREFRAFAGSSPIEYVNEVSADGESVLTTE